MVTYIDEHFHLPLTLRGFDYTEPQENTPEPHERDKVFNIVAKHIADEACDADRVVRRRNPWGVYHRIGVDVAGRDLDMGRLAELVDDYPPKGEFPTTEALEDFTTEIYGWVDDNQGRWGA